MKTYFRYLTTAAMAGLIAPATLFAAGPVKTINTADGVLDAIKNVGDWMYTIFLALAVIMIIYAAFIYLTSGGGDGVARAHRMLLYAAVAVAVAVSANGIIKLVEGIVTK